MKNNSAVRGNALPLILVVVALAAAGIGGWMYLKKAQTVAPALTEDVLSKNDVPAQVPATEGATDAISPETPAPADTAGQADVAIDVAQATGVRAIGDPNAPVKIIEYASLTCSHCAHFHNDVLPQMKTKYIDTGKVYLEFREFPLNDPALKAALTARCLPPSQYENFTGLLFKTQESWAGGIDYMASLKQNAKLAGMSDATFEACQAEPMLKLKIAENMQQAKDKWNISSTPTFVINDGAEIVSGAQPLQEFERVFAKVTNNAVGEAPAVE